MIDEAFRWPGSYTGAVSFTFDDARLSQIDYGMQLFEEHDVRCTFYVSPAGVEARLDGWRRAVEAGHEIGNHSLRHPCTANYAFSRAKPACTEDYSLEDMAGELSDADERIRELLGVSPRTFAYPCGETHVGRGAQAVSYIPLVARRYVAGRGYYHDHPNDPRFCDLAHLLSYRFDIQPVEQHTVALEGACHSGEWVVLSGHETGGPEDDFLNISIPDLRAVLRYLDDRRESLWVAPVAEVAAWIAVHRAGTRGTIDAYTGEAVPCIE